METNNKRKFPVCCQWCGKELEVSVTEDGNINRPNDFYCEDCWKDFSDEEKRILNKLSFSL